MKLFKVHYSLGNKRYTKLVRACSAHLASRAVAGQVLRIEQTSGWIYLQWALIKCLDCFKSLLPKRLKTSLIIQSLTSISMMLEAGVGLLECLDAVVMNCPSKKGQEVFAFLRQDIASGLNLAQSFQRRSAEFGELVLAYARLAQSSGRVGASFAECALALERKEAISDSLRKASAYPSFVFFSTIIAFCLLFAFVVPSLSQTLLSAKVELPFITKVLLGIYGIFCDYGWFILTFLISILFALVLAYRRLASLRVFFAKALLKIPIIGKCNLYANCAIFSLVLSELLSAGMPILQALEQACLASNNIYLRQKFQNISKALSNGLSLHESFKRAGVLDEIALWLVATSQRTGNLAMMLARANKHYERLFEGITSRLNALLEPILLLFVGGLVFILALGVLLPVWDMASMSAF